MKLLSIEELEEEVELQKWMRGCEGFKITKEFKLGDGLEVVIQGLGIVIEDDFVILHNQYDEESNDFMLAIIKDSIRKIEFNIFENNIIVAIATKYGHIRIKSF